MNNIDFSFLRVLLLGWLFTLSVFAQTNNQATDRLIERLDFFSKKKTPELIYLQTSKGVYETKEDVWFKAYVLNAQLFTPSVLSKTLYVQLISEESNKTVWQEKYEIENGFVDGHIYLQDSLLDGSYALIAYSSPSFYKGTKEYNAIRKLKIIKKITLRKTPIEIKKDSVIDFITFPEGGNLISGIKNKLAFKAVNSKGEPVFVSGTLFENNSPLLEFKSIHAGMGSLDFTPDKYKKYHIELFESKKNKRYLLPEIKNVGINLRLIKTTEEFLMFEITKNAKYSKENVYFRLQIRGVVYSTATAKLKNSFKIKVPLKGLPQGIAEVTLYNNDLIPVCERLVYVNLNRKLTIKTSIYDLYTTREKITLKIKVTDQNEKPVVAHLGLSVYDKIYQNNKDPKNILTHFYLSTQLRGKVYNPAYYFNENNEKRLKYMDLLLLTQGWRSYIWNETNLNEIKNNIVISDGIKGEVKVRKKRSKQPLEQPMLIVYVPDKKELVDFVIVDSLGQFTITSKHLKMGEKGYVYLKLLASEKNKFTFNLKDFHFKTINSIRDSILLNYPLSNLNKEEKDIFISYIPTHNVTQLDEIVVKSKKRKKIRRDKYLGKLDSIAKLEMTNDYVCKENILNCPVHGSFEKESKKPVEGEIYNLHWRTVYKKHGISVESGSGNSTRIMNPPLPPYHYLALTDEYLLTRFNLIRTKGYYGKKKFYQPNYDKKSTDNSFPDYRNTLLWNPSIITDNKGEAIIEFYCSDINTKFIGIIEGVSGEGLLGSELFEFSVKK